MDIVSYEMIVVENRYNRALKKLTELALHSDRYKNIVYRMLTSTVLSDVMGAMNKCGYKECLTSSPLEIMEFVAFFVSHELLDDGSPGITWHKYNMHSGEMELCDESKAGAKPFCNRYMETSRDGRLLDVDGLLWLINWHEQYEREFYMDMSGEQPPAVSPMLVKVAGEIMDRQNGSDPYNTALLSIDLIFIVCGEDIVVRTSLLAPLYISRGLALSKGHYILQPASDWFIIGEDGYTINPSKTPYSCGLDHGSRLFLSLRDNRGRR